MNTFRFSKFALLLCGFGFSAPRMAFAQDQTSQNLASETSLLNPLFSDDAVLQRDRVIPIWGQAAPGETVTAKLDDQTRTARADASGRWMVRVGPFAASKAPHALSVSGGTQTVTRSNIVFGDVWLCSGQANMEMGVGQVNNAQQEIGAANFPLIRLLKVPNKASFKPLQTIDAHWLVCNPQSLAAGGNGFSAVAYFFGRKLQQELGVPIGLIDSSWGETQAEQWVSASALGTLPDFKAQLALAQEAFRNEKVPFAQREEAWIRQNSPAYISNWATLDANVSQWPTIRVPGTWDGSGDAGLSSFDGIAFFRREIEVPQNWAGHDLTLKLGGIDDMDTTYWNGVAVGSSTGWNTPRRYTIPAAQVKADRNVIAVRVTDMGGNGGFGGAPDDLRLELDAKTFLPLASDWKFQKSVSMAQMATAPLDASKENPSVVTAQYNGMIAPLVPFGLRGVIWYQGEANAGREEQYGRLLPALMSSWRRDFESPLPFYTAQLAGYMAPDDTPRSDDWPRLRAVQWKIAQNDPNSGIAITTDIGDQNDTHPKNKQDVGLRLALIALAKTYRQQVEYLGPGVQAVLPKGDSIEVKFAHAMGLSLKGDATRVFAVAGADRNWFWATPRIEAGSVILTSPVVPRPIYVRYAWSNQPRATLSNAAGLPAPPFQNLP